MNIFKFVLIIGFVTSQVYVTSSSHGGQWRFGRALKDQLINFLETKMRDLMRHGNETWGIPVLDILEQAEQVLEIDAKEIALDGTLYDLNVKGLSEYKVVDGDIGILPPKLTVSLKFAEIIGKGFYDFNGEALGIIPLYGEGKFDVIVRNFSFDVVIGVGLTGHLIKSMKLNIALGALKLDITGLFNDEGVSKLLSLVISDMVPNFIADFHDNITAYIEPKAMEIMNEKFDGMSWKDLLELLG